MSYNGSEIKGLLTTIKNSDLTWTNIKDIIDEIVSDINNLEENQKIENLNNYFNNDSKIKKKTNKTKEVNIKDIINRVCSAITLTFCDASENHVGMEQNGKKGQLIDSFDLNDLEQIKINFEKNGYKCNLVYLNEYCNKEDLPDGKDFEDAYILIVKKGVECLLDKKGTMDDLFNELISFDWDTKYFDNRRQKVLNKRARANVCFSKKGQLPNYEEKKGTIIAYESVPLTNQIRKSIKKFVGDKGQKLEAEGNLYFDKNKCGIGYHGDGERVKVIGARIGSMVLVYQWYFNCLPIGSKCVLELDDSDLYFMSTKAVGNDWKCRSKITLRHAAGCNTYTKLK